MDITIHASFLPHNDPDASRVGRQAARDTATRLRRPRRARRRHWRHAWHRAWEAVGVPYAERGRRTDEALALLPGLIRGETTRLPSGASITLSPGADVRPILIGGNSPAALRRAARHGAGWFSSVTTPQRVADGALRLPDTAQIAVGCIAMLGADATDPRIAAFVAALTDSHGIPAEEAADVPITASGSGR